MTFAVNTVILLLVFGLMGFFYLLDAPFLVYFSIPTSMIYLIGYWLISKELLYVYVRMVYLWLTLYMGITTIFLGYDYGFHLYCFSMIPITYVTEYMAYKLKGRSLHALHVSLAISVFYLICTGYVAYFGPIYDRDHVMAGVFWIFNAVAVFGFLIFYSNYLIKTIISSEEKLREMAQVDRLTKLYNRNYLMGQFDGSRNVGADGFIAMVDIDDFKKINDRYGHAAGDEVLMTVSDIMKNVCKDCDVARWGGEEFLIYSGKGDGVELMEALRKKIEEKPVTWEKEQIPVTVTIGVSKRLEGQGLDEWIHEADKKLYYGKNNGKNVVIR